MDVFEYIASPFKQTHIRKMCQALQEMFQKTGPLTSTEWKYLEHILASPCVPNDVRREVHIAVQVLLSQVEPHGAAPVQGSNGSCA